MSEGENLFDALVAASAQGLDQDELETLAWDRFGLTCAMLVMDSTGFSRTTQKRGIVYYLSILARVRVLVGNVFEENGALRWRAEADNFFAEFPTVDAAVKSAFEVHRLLRKKGFPLSEKETFTVCAGVGYGRVLEAGPHGVYGDEMNLAAKLGEDLAVGGETLLTEDAFVNLKNRKEITANRRLITMSGVEIPYFSINPD